MRFIGIVGRTCLAALMAAGCASRPGPAPGNGSLTAPPAATALPDLAGSLDALRSWFVSHRGTPRALILLSPT